VDAVTKREIDLSLPYAALVDALSDLGSEEFIELIKDVEDRICEWDTIVLLKKWVDRRHRVLAQEEADEQARRLEHCVRSAEYGDIWGHFDPHVKCILR
jgi:hypothetical protein